MELILLLVLLTLSAFFSGSETAFFSLRQSELARLGGRGDRAGRKVVSLLSQANNLLSALLIGNLVVNTAASVVATSLCIRIYGENGLAVAVPAITAVQLILGEISPKMLALRYRQQLVLVAQRPLSVWLWLTGPLLAIIDKLTRQMLRSLPWERTGSRGPTTEELETACDLAVAEGTLSVTEGHFLARMLLLLHLEVQHVMTPRPEVVTLQVDWSRDEILATAREAGFNRYPVIAPDKAQPIGLFHLKDLLEQEHPLSEGLRPLLFVPESKDVAALLAEMRSGQTHLAAVVDEHGDFTGIITMADCLQAMTGHTGETSDSADREVFRIGDQSWVMGGRLDMREVKEVCGVSLPTSREYVTLAGFLMTYLGRIPHPGERVVTAGTRFTVLEMSRHKIVRVQIERLETEQQEVES